MEQQTKQVTRTPYMERLMSETYSQCAINAVVNGTIEGAWEQAISERLRRDSMSYKNNMKDMSNAIETADLLGLFDRDDTEWDAVAAAILNTKPPTE